MADEVRARHVLRKERVVEVENEDPGRRSGDETWSLLLRVSAETFARGGYSGTSLQGIAEAVGMLKGSLYYYIHSKEDLLYEIVRDVLQRAIQALTPAAESPGTGLERLGGITVAHVHHLIAHLPETTVYLNDVARLSPDRREQLPEKEYVGVFDRLIGEGQADGSIDPDLDPWLTRRSVLGLANSVAGWYAAAHDVSPDAVAEHISGVVQGGLRPRS